MEAMDNLLEKHLGEELQRMSEPLHHALGVDEREKHLIHNIETPSAADMVRVKDGMGAIDSIIDDAFDKVQSKAQDERILLTDLLIELQNLSEKMVSAEARDLIRLVDRLYEIEMKLHLIDPQRWPVPEMPKSRRKVKRKEPEPEIEPEPFSGPMVGNLTVAGVRKVQMLNPEEGGNDTPQENQH